MRVAVLPYTSKETLFTRTDEAKENRRKMGSHISGYLLYLVHFLLGSMYYLIYLTLSYMSSGDIINFWAPQVWHFHRPEAAYKYNGFSLSVSQKAHSGLVQTPLGLQCAKATSRVPINTPTN